MQMAQVSLPIDGLFPVGEPSHIQLFLISRAEQPAGQATWSSGESVLKSNESDYSLDQLSSQTARTVSDGFDPIPVRQRHLFPHFRVIQVSHSPNKIVSSYNTDEVRMSWAPSGVSKMREKMELADYELVDIRNIRNTEVCSSFMSVIYCYSHIRPVIGTS